MKYSARSIVWLGLVFWSMTPPETPLPEAPPAAAAPDAERPLAGGSAIQLASGPTQATLAARIEAYCRQEPGACLRMVRQAAQLAGATEPGAGAPETAGRSADAGLDPASGGTLATALALVRFGQDTLTAQDRAPSWRGPALPANSAP